MVMIRPLLPLTDTLNGRTRTRGIRGKMQSLQDSGHGIKHHQRAQGADSWALLIPGGTNGRACGLGQVINLFEPKACSFLKPESKEKFRNSGIRKPPFSPVPRNRTVQLYWLDCVDFIPRLVQFKLFRTEIFKANLQTAEGAR